FSSATIAGQIDTLMPMMAAVTVVGPSARAGAAIVNARLSAPARMGRRQDAKRDVAKSVAKSNVTRSGRSPADDRACGAEATGRRLRRASPKSKFDAMRPPGAAVGQQPGRPPAPLNRALLQTNYLQQSQWGVRRERALPG